MPSKMPKPDAIWRAWAARVLACALLALALAAPAGAAEPPSYSFGVAPQSDPRTLYDKWRPVLDQLEKHSRHRFQLRFSPHMSAFEQDVAQARFDFVYLNPYRALVANREQGYVPLVRDIGEKLQGILVVRSDSSIGDVRELSGKVVAFPSPNALGASLLPRAHLAAANIEVQPRYVGNHSSVYLNVALGQAAAGGGIQDTFNEQPPRVRDSLRVLYRSAAFPSHPVMANPRIPAAVRDAVQAAFLALGASAEGRALLAKASFKEIGRASPADYEPLARLGLERFYVAD